MSWNVEIRKIVRYLIGDISSTPDNSDEDIENTIVVAAQLTQMSVDFEQAYEIDVDGVTISPDPTSTAVGGSNKDNAFINLVALRTACIISKGDAKIGAGGALSVQDGLSRVDTRDKGKMLMEMSKNYCEEYEKAVEEYEMGQRSPGMAVIGPYADYMSWYGDDRSRTVL